MPPHHQPLSFPAQESRANCSQNDLPLSLTKRHTVCGHQPPLLRVPTEISRSSTETAIRHVEQIIMTIMTKNQYAPPPYASLGLECSSLRPQTLDALKFSLPQITSNGVFKHTSQAPPTCGSPQWCQVYKNGLLLFHARQIL